MKLLRPNRNLTPPGVCYVVGVDLAFSGPTGLALLQFADSLIANQITGLSLITPPRHSKRKDGSDWRYLRDILVFITCEFNAYLKNHNVPREAIVAVEIPGGRRPYTESRNMFRLGLSVGAFVQNLEYRRPVILVDTTTIRYYLCNNVTASKRMVRTRVKELYGDIVDIPNDDNLVDAIAVAHAGFLLAVMRRAQQEAEDVR